MLSKQLFFIIVMLAITKAAKIQPSDLVEEVGKQLDELKEIVIGQIFYGQNSVSSLLATFQRNAAITISSAIIYLNQEQDTVHAQLQTLKDLAHSAGVDPSSCIAPNEDTIEIFPSRYTKQITECITELTTEAKDVSENAKYTIDISYSTVNHLEDQVFRCKGDLLCLAPILTEIELNKIKLPQNIQSEIQIFDSTLKTLNLSIEDCSDKNLAQYLDLVNLILEQMESCIEDLLS